MSDIQILCGGDGAGADADKKATDQTISGKTCVL